MIENLGGLKCGDARGAWLAVDEGKLAEELAHLEPRGFPKQPIAEPVASEMRPYRPSAKRERGSRQPHCGAGIHAVVPVCAAVKTQGNTITKSGRARFRGGSWGWVKRCQRLLQIQEDCLKGH